MRISRAIAAATCVSLLVSMAACNNNADPQVAGYSGAYLYGTDGNMSNGFGDLFADKPGMIAGMKGTVPMTELSDEFVDQLRKADSKLKDFSYAGEAYDAVVISALAAEMAGSSDARQIAKQINGVTTGGTVCRTVKACLDSARAGTNIAYRGVTVRYGFTDAGEPATASYATLHFDASNQVDNGKTEFLATGNELDVTKVEPPKAPTKQQTGATPLTFGALMPVTGKLSFISGPMLAAARVAIAEINAAGGVLGKPVVWHDGDDGTSVKVATQWIGKHKEAGVQVLIGTGASGVALATLPEAVKDGMIMFSPSNTSASLTTADDKGLYFRTAPSDILQARAIADVMMRDGVRRITIIAHSENYGTKLQADVRKELVTAGLSEAAIQVLVYQVADGGAVKDQNELVTIAGQVTAFRPDGVLVIGYEESADAIKALAAAGQALRH